MCEWLSSGEWCDVHLVCAGRTFNAHRAVLACVSEFLRKVLLSCPQDETPIIIVLPDFDMEAMSSVLYYIYNGEVVLEKNKTLLFLDMIKTLEIYIDHQYLEILTNENKNYLDVLSQEQGQLAQNIFTLKSKNGNEYKCVNIRKEVQFQDPRQQYLQSGSDVGDKASSCGRSDVSPSLDNSQAPYGDRQRNCFLRDLYIETYPQNGNVNGRRGGVLAIPNERYRVPKSVLLANANGKLPNRVDDILSKVSKPTGEASDYTSFLLNISREQEGVQECIQLRKESDSKDCSDKIHWKSFDVSNSRLFIDNNYLRFNGKTSVISCNIPKSYQSFSGEMTQRQFMRSTSLDLRITQSFSGSVVPNTYDKTCKYLESINLFRNNSCNTRKYTTEEEGKRISSKILKTPIFNQVIESPWRPRLPNSYKPFQRKELRKFDTASHCKLENAVEKNIINDSNNNIDDLKTIHRQYVNNGSASTTEFVCAICSQAFTCEDNLSTHMKRHTTVPRYSCSDCGKTFSQLRNFKYHMSVHRGTKEFAATCTVCGKYFNDRGYLSSHMKIHRNRKEYKCPMCPKSFNQRVAYNMHVRIHTGVKPHVCDECGKAFSRKMLLKQHQRTHSGERPYACPHCDKRFADRSNMTLHLRLHTGVKPFSCSLCPKSFTKKHHLKSHLNFHTGAKPYSCPRCHLAFTQSSNMRTHLKKCSVTETSSPA